MEPLSNVSNTTNTLLKYTTNILLFFAISSYIGLGIAKPSIVSVLDYYLKIFLALYLLYRFNPFKKEFTFKELDRRVAFSAGVFIFTTTILSKMLIKYSDQYRDIILQKINETAHLAK
jgi:hypothetical protein